LDLLNGNDLPSTAAYSQRRSSSTTLTAGLSIFTPTSEIPFAGHPTVGAAWMLAARRLAGHANMVSHGDCPT
jgi:predicted PhzF superfamily epimerase YddE/YHI9